MGIAAAGFGLFGFIFALLAYSEVQSLKKRVAELELGDSASQ